MRLVDRIFDDMLIESASVKVIFPEGCTDQDLATIPVSCGGDSKHYINLDTIGRGWRIAVPSHQRCFWSLFCWGFAFFLFFLLSIIYVRMDSPSQWMRELKLR